MTGSGWWWFKNLVHIETLFYIIVIALIIYFLITKKNDKSKSFLDLLKESTGGVKFKRKFRRKKKVFVSEEKCRKIFENIYGCEFKKIRPPWLKNPLTGKNLELDGFNPDIPTRLGKGVAFECDGQQHFEYVKYFHKSVEDYRNQIKRDDFKTQKCKQQGILLIRVPYYWATAPVSDLTAEILRRIKVEENAKTN